MGKDKIAWGMTHLRKAGPRFHYYLECQVWNFRYLKGMNTRYETSVGQMTPAKRSKSWVKIFQWFIYSTLDHLLLNLRVASRPIGRFTCNLMEHHPHVEELVWFFGADPQTLQQVRRSNEVKEGLEDSNDI
jgi:hypothetical protein